MKYTISKKYIKRVKRSPVSYTVLGVVLGSIPLLGKEVPVYIGVSVTISVAILMGGARWLWVKKRVKLYYEHKLEVSQGNLTLENEGMKSTLQLSFVHKIILYKKGNSVHLIAIETTKGYKEWLYQYENMSELADSLQKYVPLEKIKVKSWLYLYL